MRNYVKTTEFGSKEDDGPEFVWLREIKTQQIITQGKMPSKDPESVIDKEIRKISARNDAVSYTHLDVYKRQVFTRVPLVIGHMMVKQWITVSL